MGRRVKRSADGLAVLALLIGAAALAIGYYIQTQLRPYRIFHVFTATERGWRDQAFEVGFYACVVGGVLFVVARAVRR